MARKQPLREPQPARLTIEQMRSAIPKLRRRIEEVSAFDPQTINDRSDPRPEAIARKIDSALVDILGSDTLDYQSSQVGSLDRAGMQFGGTPLDEVREGLARGKVDAISKLTTLIEIFAEKIADLQQDQVLTTSVPAQQPRRKPQSVFVVHGHDGAAREAVARFLDRLGVRTVILHEQANQGHTIVEKLEHHGDVDFAVILLTPDDEGRERRAEQPLKPRARQNVVLELGYFLGRLSRERVCALYRGEVEIPSDYMGVTYLPLDDESGWHLRLAKELRAAGFAIDMNKL